MSFGRKTVIFIAVLLVLLAGVLFLVLTNMDSIVRAAIEKYGSEAVKTAVRVSSVRIRLSSGEGTIRRLTVANPSGFSSDHAFSFGKISARIDTGTITSDIVVIDKILISDPRVLYEVNSSGKSNIDVLKKNIRQPAAKKTPEKNKSDSKEKKYIIKKLVIENGRIDIRLAGNKPETIVLPRIERSGIGRKDGATPSQVADEISSALMEEVGITVARLGAESFFSRGFKGIFGK